MADKYVEQAWSYDKDSWRHILPALSASDSVLCLDARFGNTAAAFAETGVSVTVIHPCPVTVHIIQHRLASMNIQNVEVIHVPLETARFPFPDNSFHAFIHHDVVATLHADEAIAASPFASLTSTLFSETYRVLKPGGFAHFGAKNPYGYARLLRRVLNSSGSPSKGSRLTPMHRAKNLIRQAGFLHLRAHPYLVENDNVHEIIAPSGYRSTKNSLATSERLKQIVLGKTGARFLAPAYGLVCSKNQNLPLPLESFIDDLCARNILSKTAGKSFGFQRYLSLPGKAIITLGNNGDDKQNVIIVIPKVARVLDWRRKEIVIVNEVRAVSPFLASRLPRLYTECSIGDMTYFAISEIPGMTIDRRVRELERLTCNAVDFLIRFNQITTREISIDEAVFDGLFGSLIRQVIATYPDTRQIMEKIEAHLRRVVPGRNIATVWLHGDYKLENLIFDKKTLEINGIIDWEHSRRDNLPWLDLMYLLVYNRIMTQEHDFFAAYREVILDENLTNHENTVMASYASTIPVTPDMKTVLSCLFLLHHIGFRYIYVMRRELDRHNIFNALDNVEKRLARLSI
ncbi:MAG: phosphotransferase [Sulfuricaulis sp.]|uniref:phosphotransferase n=1 Tax=Sulfuricaulis sp. TaxID=2003553 RepID=UPI0025D45CB7|nr:phosphotransferase [Sulfuricaulis sp.]MCR4346532.1 phosphotransferase [Sulfuricaulis sp.]